MTKKTIRIFLSYAFTPKQNAYSKKEIQQVLEDSIKIVRRKLGKEKGKVGIKADYELSEYGGVLRSELLSKIGAADIFIVDISDNNPNVFYELGYIDALKKPAIILKSRKEEDHYQVPSDISDRFFLKYDSINNITTKLAESLRNRIEELLSIPQIDLDDLKRIWFPDNPQTINVIGPPSQSKTQFSDAKSPNFVYLDRLGDKDSISEVLVLLSRLYPSTKIRKFRSDEFQNDMLDENLVIIGGPGTSKEIGNSVCKLISEKIHSPVSYSDDCEKMLVGKKTLPSIYENNQVATDYGYFARIKNPLNPRSTVVLIHGIHTYGVLGSAKAFSEHDLSIKNIQRILDNIGLNPFFESWFKVDVYNGIVKIPEVKNIRKF